jgi:hypothetical protein
MNAIWSRAVFANTELQTAAKAGAVYAVARHRQISQRRRNPQVGTSLDIETSLHDDVSRSPIEPPIRKRGMFMNFTCRKIHGRISLPKGWYLALVKSDAEFENDEPGPIGIFEPFKAPFRRPEPRQTKLAKSYNAVKSIIALIQACFAITTLYRSRGTQIDQFGYAAFGLTVAPYAFMSIVNLIGNLICPEYPAAFLVENIELDSMRERIAALGKQVEFFVEGTVGRIAMTSDQSIIDDSEDAGEAAAERRTFLQPFDTIREVDNSLDQVVFSISCFGISYPIKKDALKKTQIYIKAFAIIALIAAVSVSIIGGLSRFKEGQSTHAQRVWTMTWLAFGFMGTAFSYDDRDDNGFESGESGGPFQVYLWPFALFYGAPAVGGFIVVGQMIT